MKKAMLVIGNGFDLSLGYQTGYSHFYKNSILLKQYANKGNQLCKHIIENITGELWKDLECGLYQYSLALTQQFGVGNTRAAANFQKEFSELRSALFEYLKKELEKHVLSSSIVSILLPEWKRFNLQCLSFNYTSTIAVHLNGNGKRVCFNNDDSINTEVLIYRHGTLYNPKDACNNNPEDIVVGIDDSQSVEPLHSFLYKTLQQIQYPTDELIKSIESKDVYIVYGCSMGDTDRFYFEHLFNKNFMNKHYIIYGYDNKSIMSLKGIIHNFVGGLSAFQCKNKIDFINCQDINVRQNTQQIIDDIINKN